jgi:hypothetical protein
MRVVHLDRPVGTIPFLPICGDWGSPDSDGTKEPRGVTCRACLAVMARATADAPLVVAVPLHRT